MEERVDPRAFASGDSVHAWAALVAAAADAIIATDEAHRIIVFNPAAERMFARPAMDVLGTDITRLFAAEARDRLGALLQGAARPDAPEELLHGLRNGTPVPLGLSIGFSGAAGVRCVMVLREVGDRLDEALDYARLVHAQEEERSRLESVVHAAPIGIIVYDVGGRIMFNQRAQELLEVDLRGGPAFYAGVMLGAKEAPLTVDQLPSQRALRGETVRGVELMLAPPSGRRWRILCSAVPVRAPGGRIIGAVSVFDDVTVLRQREDEQRFLARTGEALAKSFDERSTLAEIVGLVVPQLADGCIAFAVEGDELKPVAWASDDPACAQRLDALRTGSSDSPDDAAALVPRRDDAWSFTPASLPADDATRRICERIGARACISVPLVARGRLVGAVTMFDTSRRSRLGPAALSLAIELGRRAALAIDNARLFKTEQEARRARDEVLAIVAHDLRNPLSAIDMASSLVERGTIDPEVQRRLQTIRRAAGRMNRLIQDLLDITKLESGRFGLERALVPANELLGDAIELARSLADGRRVELAAADSLPALNVDRDRVLQVFSNLIGNAVKFTPASGSIRLCAEARKDEVVFGVSDDGPGISPEALPHIFDRFYQARPSDRRGAGLGLAICRGIVLAHGGRIWAESAPGQGTLVKFSLPIG